MKEKDIKTVLDVAAAFDIVGPNFSDAENAGGLIALARYSNLCGDWDDRDKNIRFLILLANAFGLTNDGPAEPEKFECNIHFLVDLAESLGVISDYDDVNTKHGIEYVAVETDRDFIINLYKQPSVMGMLRAAVDALAECTPLAKPDTPDNETGAEKWIHETIRNFEEHSKRGGDR